MNLSVHTKRKGTQGLIKSYPWISMGSFVLLLVFANMYQRAVEDQKALRRQRGSPPLLSILLSVPQHTLASIPIIRMNLLCAKGLGNEIDLAESESTLRSWAKHVKSETELHFYRFRQHPEQFE